MRLNQFKVNLFIRIKKIWDHPLCPLVSPWATQLSHLSALGGT